jgi:hypothetical protein
MCFSLRRINNKVLDFPWLSAFYWFIYTFMVNEETLVLNYERVQTIELSRIFSIYFNIVICQVTTPGSCLLFSHIEVKGNDDLIICHYLL